MMGGKRYGCISAQSEKVRRGFLLTQNKTVTSECFATLNASYKQEQDNLVPAYIYIRRSLIWRILNYTRSIPNILSI